MSVDWNALVCLCARDAQLRVGRVARTQRLQACIETHVRRLQQRLQQWTLCVSGRADLRGAGESWVSLCREAFTLALAIDLVVSSSCCSDHRYGRRC